VRVECACTRTGVRPSGRRGNRSRGRSTGRCRPRKRQRSTIVAVCRPRSPRLASARHAVCSQLSRTPPRLIRARRQGAHSWDPAPVHLADRSPDRDTPRRGHVFGVTCRWTWAWCTCSSASTTSRFGLPSTARSSAVASSGETFGAHDEFAFRRDVDDELGHADFLLRSEHGSSRHRRHSRIDARLRGSAAEPARRAAPPWRGRTLRAGAA
jgi:hypothetical protein